MGTARIVKTKPLRGAKAKAKITAGLVQSEYQQLLNIVEKDFNILRDSTSDEGIGLWAAEMKTMIDLMTLKSMFFAEDWVFICVDRIASRIALCPLIIMAETDVKGKKVKKEVSGHPTQAIINQPNAYQSYYNWMYCIAADRVMLGNAVNWLQTSARQIIPIPGESVSIMFTPQGGIQSYNIVQMSWDELPDLRKVTKVDPAQICHIRRPNPSSLLWGLSPFVPGRKAMLFNRYSTEYLNNYYVKGAQPGLALEIGNEANEKLALRLLRSFEMAYTGRKNQRRNMVLPKGVTAKEISHRIADQSLTDLISMNRETIINILGIPKHEFSIAESGSLGSQEAKTALKNFWGGTLKTEMSGIKEALTKKFRAVGWLQPNECLEFDMSQVEAVQEDKMQKALLAKEMVGITHTVNEVRAELYELPPIQGGDVLTQPTAQPAVPSVTTPKAPNEPQAPAAPVQQMDAPEIQVSSIVDNTKEIQNRNMERFHQMSADNGSWWDKRKADEQRSTDDASGKLYKATLSLFGDQAEYAFKLAKEYLRDSKALKALLINKTELRRRLSNGLLKFEDKWINEFILALEAQVDFNYDLALKLPFNLPNQDRLDALKAQNESKRREILEARGIDTFAQMKETTTNKIMSTIEEGVAKNQTIQEIAKAIKENLADADIAEHRLMTIARTETLTAASIGQAAAMEDAATVVPNLKKMWINAGDDRVRGNPDGKFANSKADHWEMQGQVRPYDKPFTDSKNGAKLDYPRDLNAGPEETINCRCAFIMVPGDDADKLGLEELTSD